MKKMMRKKIYQYACLAVFVVTLSLIGSMAYRINSYYSSISDTIDEAKAIDSCKINLEAIGVLLDVYRHSHKEQLPIEISEIFKDKNVLEEPVFGLPGIAPGTEYKTKKERLEHLLVCPGVRYGNTLSYVFRGDDLTTSHPSELILMYDINNNHDGVRNVLFNSGNPRVQTLQEHLFIDALKLDNQLRKEHNLSERKP